jgi:adenylate kinase family enzyme
MVKDGKYMNIAENILKHSLKNVYFLTGTGCGGKTTMAKELSKKYGFIHFNDNWHEENFKVWQSIINEKYQPNSTKRKEIDWEKYFSRSVEEFLADKNDTHGENEYLGFSIIELVKLSQNNKVVADIWIEEMSLLTEISEYNRIACLLAPGELIIRDYYVREDHKEFTECIQSLKNPEMAFKTQNELFRIGAKEMAEKARDLNLYCIMRSEESTVEGTLKMLEKHFNL